MPFLISSNWQKVRMHFLFFFAFTQIIATQITIRETNKFFFMSSPRRNIASIFLPGGAKNNFYFLAAAIFDHLISTRSYLRCVKFFLFFTAGWAKKLSTTVRKFPERKIKFFLKMLYASCADFSWKFLKLY